MLGTERDPTFGPETRGNSIPSLRRQKSSDEPITITVNGKVHHVTDDETFEILITLIDRLETIDAIREGLESMKRGEGRPVEEFFDELEQESQASRRT